MCIVQFIRKNTTFLYTQMLRKKDTLKSRQWQNKYYLYLILFTVGYKCGIAQLQVEFYDYPQRQIMYYYYYYDYKIRCGEWYRMTPPYSLLQQPRQKHMANRFLGHFIYKYMQTGWAATICSLYNIIVQNTVPDGRPALYVHRCINMLYLRTLL